MTSAQACRPNDRELKKTVLLYRAYTWLWCGNLWERDHMEDPDVDGRIILRWLFSKWNVGAWTGSSWLRIGIDGGHV